MNFALSWYYSFILGDETQPQTPKQTRIRGPTEGDVFIFKGESGELMAATPSKTSNVHDEGFHRCDYVLPDGTKCECL